MTEQNQRIPAAENRLIDQVERYVAEKNDEALRLILAELHPVDLAGLLEYLDEEDRHILLGLVGDEFLGETVLHLPEEQREDYLGDLGAARIVEIVEELDPDDATDTVFD